MSLILVNSHELVVGKPLPWALYDSMHNLLLAQGETVRDEDHRKALLADGACHELSWEGGDKNKGDGPAGEEAPAPEQSEENKGDAGFTFDDMKLRVEDRLQLEPPPQLSKERLVVKVIGFMRGISLLVTTPVMANGQRLQLLENEQVIMRSFSGKNAFAFACNIVKVNKIPFDYLHLSFPDNIQGLAIRKTARVKTRIIAAVQNNEADVTEQMSAIISDISATGLSLDAKKPLGKKGDILNLAFRVHLHSIEAFLSLKGVIRAVIIDEPSPGHVRYGIELQNLQPNDSVILQSMIYQQMIENPQKLV